MAYVLIFLAVVALLAAGALWYADSRQRPAEPEPRRAPEPPAALEAPQSEPEALPEPQLEPAPEPAPEPVKLATPHRSSGLQLPGSARRERRAWAQAKGLEFSRSDELLGGEWTRGAAASGATWSTTVPYAVPLIRPSQTRTMSRTPWRSIFFGRGRLATSGIPG